MKKKMTRIAMAIGGALTAGKKVYGNNAMAVNNTRFDSTIGAEAAWNAALVDAGVNADAITCGDTRHGFSDGIKTYTVDFVADGIDYDYTIDAMTGDVIAKDDSTAVWSKSITTLN